MTWGEFKQLVESQGVRDDDEMWYIDTSLGYPAPEAERDPVMGWSIS